MLSRSDRNRAVGEDVSLDGSLSTGRETRPSVRFGQDTIGGGTRTKQISLPRTQVKIGGRERSEPSQQTLGFGNCVL